MFYLLTEQQDVLSLKLKNKQPRFHTQLVHLLSRFRDKDAWPVYKVANGPSQVNDNTLDVLFNLLSYCMCLVSRSGTNVIFAPSIKFDSSDNVKGPIPPLTVVGYTLTHAIAQYSDLLAEIGQGGVPTTVSNIPDHVIAELDPNTAQALQYMSLEEREVKLRDLMAAHLASKDSQATKLFSIIEISLSLIWRHLDHYLHPSKLSAQQLYYQNYYPNTTTTTTTRNEDGFGGAIALQQAEIDQLRNNARAFFNSRYANASSLLNKVTELAANKKGSNVEYVVQKLKELLRDTIIVNR